MTEALIALFALAYSGTVLFALAGALRKRMPPRRAALTALGLSAAVHAVTLFFAPADQRGFFLAFWAIPHLLLAVPLLWLAGRRA
jgi:Na+/melibiose symporter-like transporter